MAAGHRRTVWPRSRAGRRRLGRPQCGVGPEEAAQHVGRERFQVLDRLGLRGDQAARRPAGAAPDADLPEVVVRGAPFPQPLAQRDRPQPGRVGVQPPRRAVLLDEGRPHGAPLLAQVTQVVASVALGVLLVFAGVAQERNDRHAQHGDHHQHHADVGEDAGARPQQHQHDGERADAHGYVQQDLPGTPGRRFRHHGRGLQLQVAGGGDGAGAPRLADEDDRAHLVAPFVRVIPRTGGAVPPPPMAGRGAG